MFTPITDEPYIKLIITIHVTSLAVVETFVYLGNTLTNVSSLDSEIHQRI